MHTNYSSLEPYFVPRRVWWRERDRETGMKEEMNIKNIDQLVNYLLLQSTEGKNPHLMLNFIKWELDKMRLLTWLNMWFKVRVCTPREQKEPLVKDSCHEITGYLFVCSCVQLPFQNIFFQKITCKFTVNLIWSLCWRQWCIAVVLLQCVPVTVLCQMEQYYSMRFVSSRCSLLKLFMLAFSAQDNYPLLSQTSHSECKWNALKNITLFVSEDFSREKNW